MKKRLWRALTVLCLASVAYPVPAGEPVTFESLLRDMVNGVGVYWYGDAATTSNRKPEPEEVLNMPPLGQPRAEGAFLPGLGPMGAFIPADQRESPLLLPVCESLVPKGSGDGIDDDRLAVIDATDDREVVGLTLDKITHARHP